MRAITLTTDFGVNDWFVAAMKGVMLCIEPRARIVDMTHGISPGDIRAGAFALAAGCRFFPHKTVHVAVIDPGVGSPRAGIAIQTENYFFVGPDNGVLSLAVSLEKIRAIHRIENRKYLLPEVSRTFHGRDIFAPAAAHLSAGTAIRHLGPPSAVYARVAAPVPVSRGDAIHGEVLYIDRFGNMITNIPAKKMAGLDPARLRIQLPRSRRPVPFAAFYQAVSEGSPLALVGSTGFLEVAVNGGHAARKFRLRVGDRVVVRVARARSALN